MARLVSGDFADMLHELVIKFDWDPVNDQRTYSEVTANMPEPDKRELDQLLRRLLRILETIAIQIKHKIIDDSICYEYLSSMGPRIHTACATFMEKERKNRNDKRVFDLFADAVVRWERRNVENGAPQTKR